MLFNRLNRTYLYKGDFNFVNTIILKNTMNISEKFSMAYLLLIFITFFVMGFVDIVRVFTSYVKSDFVLNNPLANLLPMMVFFYACCPFGRKKQSWQKLKKEYFAFGNSEDPALIRDVLDYCRYVSVVFLKAQKVVEVYATSIGDAFGRPNLISPDMYRKFAWEP